MRSPPLALSSLWQCSQLSLTIARTSLYVTAPEGAEWVLVVPDPDAHAAASAAPTSVAAVSATARVALISMVEKELATGEDRPREVLEHLPARGRRSRDRSFRSVFPQIARVDGATRVSFFHCPRERFVHGTGERACLLVRRVTAESCQVEPLDGRLVIGVLIQQPLNEPRVRTKLVVNRVPVDHVQGLGDARLLLAF